MGDFDETPLIDSIDTATRGLAVVFQGSKQRLGRTIGHSQNVPRPDEPVLIAANNGLDAEAQPATVIGSCPPCSIWIFQCLVSKTQMHVAESVSRNVDLQPATVTEGDETLALG